MSDPVAVSFPFERLTEVVRAVLRRKSGMSLRQDDRQPENLDVLELCQDVLARLWERHATFGGEAAAWDDAEAFAATVAHNAWSDHLRRRHPRRASLRNRLRYFLAHQPRYAVWDSARGETMCGIKAWAVGGAAQADPARWQGLAEGRERLPRGSLPGGSFENFAAPEWDRLLGALYVRIGAPMPLDALVGLVAQLVGLREDRHESLDDDGDGADGEGGGAPSLAGQEPGPEAQAEARSMLRQVWSAVRGLKPDYRAAYLLNLPGPGKLRGDIEVFVLHGVATAEEIADALALTPAQMRLALESLDLSGAHRLALAADATPAERFAELWQRLPLSDAAIGRMLGLEAQQVINRRMLALRELARVLRHEPSRRSAAARR